MFYQEVWNIQRKRTILLFSPSGLANHQWGHLLGGNPGHILADTTARIGKQVGLILCQEPFNPYFFEPIH
jgi:hypothetical protein